MPQETKTAAYRINAPRVAHQTIDGETIIIDFENGAYFSAEGAGAEIWEGIARRLPAGEIAAAALRRYAGAEGDIRGGIESFIETLQRESLIVPLEGEPAESDAAQEQGTAAAGKRPDFIPPKLRKYTDMQDLLLLDPIHEVDEQGWPIAKDEPAA